MPIFFIVHVYILSGQTSYIEYYIRSLYKFSFCNQILFKIYRKKCSLFYLYNYFYKFQLNSFLSENLTLFLNHFFRHSLRLAFLVINYLSVSSSLKTLIHFYNYRILVYSSLFLNT